MCGDRIVQGSGAVVSLGVDAYAEDDIERKKPRLQYRRFMISGVGFEVLRRFRECGRRMTSSSEFIHRKNIQSVRK